jgi:2-polyprenyl-3-methyl-5-hydroxy-6-metoxy-1,4-benzoquinol methylase
MNKKDSVYKPEEYWTTVGERIEERTVPENYVAGDDEPYYRYKRKEFLKLLSKVNFKNKSILEVGCGPGGNLKHLLNSNAKSLTGCDISSQMVKLAKSNLPQNVKIVKTNGVEMPFEKKSFDIIFTATVLQHNTNETMLTNLVAEICKLEPSEIYFFERIESSVKGDELCLGRPVDYYANLMNNNGYQLVDVQFINIRVSYYVSGIIRKLFNKSSRKEGEPITPLSMVLQNITLPFTKIFDKFIRSQKDLSRLKFVKDN